MKISNFAARAMPPVIRSQMDENPHATPRTEITAAASIPAAILISTLNRAQRNQAKSDNLSAA